MSTARGPRALFFWLVLRFPLENRALRPRDVEIWQGDVVSWARWIALADTNVGDDELGDTRISTKFLGMALSPYGDPPPTFETCVFRHGHAVTTERYATWDEAERGHGEHVAQVRAEQVPI